VALSYKTEFQVKGFNWLGVKRESHLLDGMITSTYDHVTLVDSIQPYVMEVGVERTSSPQNFSMFSWDYVDDLLATKSEYVGIIVSAISFQDF